MAFVKISEQASLYDDLEKKTVGEILRDINNEDKKVALAVEKAIPQIEKLVSQIVPRMKRGGRIFYIGAGTSGRLGVLDASEIPPTFGMEPTWVIGLIAGGDTALRNPVENAEDNTTQGHRNRHRSLRNNAIRDRSTQHLPRTRNPYCRHNLKPRRTCQPGRRHSHRNGGRA